MIRRSHRGVGPADSSVFARYLLRAMGIGAAATSVVGLAACGGIAVVEGDGDGGSGGATGSTGSTGSVSSATSGSTSAASTTTGGPFECNVPITGIEELVYACTSGQTPADGCLDAGAPEVFYDLAEQLDDLGCGGSKVQSIPCGPDPTNGAQCCYFAVVQVLECGGRPFVVHGAARAAMPADRGDWRAIAAPDLSGVDAATRRSLAEGWTRDGLDEHASIASFARFVLQLLAVGAPPELVMSAQRAMGDEIRHAQLCFGLAGAYAGREIGPSSLAIEGSLESSSALVDIVAAVVREGCVGETVAAFLAATSRDAAADPAVRAALDEIVVDEASHSALAWRFVAWALARGDRSVRRAVTDAFAAAMAASPAPARAADPGDPAVLRAHGRLSDEERRRAAEVCLSETVAPCARALLANHSLIEGSFAIA